MTAKSKSIKVKTGPKVCFLVPTTALVEQQKKYPFDFTLSTVCKANADLFCSVLERHVGDICEVQDICGSASNSLMCLNRQLIDIVGVVVVTPQIILNMLEAKPEKGYEDVFEEFKLTIFSMIVFDEAHHANDQHPYNGISLVFKQIVRLISSGFSVIMQSYHSLNELIAFDGGREQKLPQIIALTASLGIGNSSTKLAEAIKHALMMCANLGVNTISRVRKNVTEMKSYTSEVSDEIVLVDADDFQNLGFYKALVKELTFLEEEILSIHEAKTDESLSNALSKNNASHLHQSYENWVCNCRRNVVPKYSSMLQESRAKLMQCFDQLSIFYHAIELLRLFGIATSLSYIEEEEKSYLATKSLQTTSHIKATLENLRRQSKSDSSMFNALIEILNKQFAEREDSRVLIFALTRFQCKCLASLLKKRTVFSSDFLTVHPSKKRVTDFDQGKTKILCVTSVVMIAEEGLDISACNLVIQYNSITNEIAHLQRRGRGRAKKAKSVILTFDSRVKARAELNQLRERLMTDALKEIDRKPELYISQIPQIAKGLREAWLLKNNLMTQNSVTLSYMKLQQKFAVVCKSCGAFLCYSDRIVLFNASQHVCVDPDYLNQITLSSLSGEGVNTNRASLRHYCVKKLASGVCGADLGALALHKTGMSLPILSCKGIVFIRVPRNHTSKIIDDTAGYSRYSFKTWKDARKLFEPNALSPSDLLVMKNANANVLKKTMQDFSMLKID